MMRERKDARPAVGAARRAMETGAACRRATTSIKNDTISAAGRQDFRVSDLLLCGAENAISRRDLMALTGCKDRELRLLIEAERRQGVPVLSDCQHGYFLPGSETERIRCVRSLRSRAREIERTADAIEGAEV